MKIDSLYLISFFKKFLLYYFIIYGELETFEFIFLTCRSIMLVDIKIDQKTKAVNARGSVCSFLPPIRKRYAFLERP